jgi:hypothetical protein
MPSRPIKCPEVVVPILGDGRAVAPQWSAGGRRQLLVKLLPSGIRVGGAHDVGAGGHCGDSRGHERAIRLESH